MFPADTMQLMARICPQVVNARTGPTVMPAKAMTRRCGASLGWKASGITISASKVHQIPNILEMTQSSFVVLSKLVLPWVLPLFQYT